MAKSHIKQSFYFTTAADYINHFMFEAMIPAHTLPQSEYITSGLIDPVWEPDYPEQMVFSQLTIHKMVMHLESGTDFIICHDHDVPEILHRIDRYFESMERALEIREVSVVRYANRLLRLRTVVYEKLFLRVVNKNPDIRQAYAGDKLALASILQLCPAFSTRTHGVFTDPIEALREPPVPIPPVEADKTSSTPISQQSLSEEEKIISSHTKNDYMGRFSM